MEPIWATLRHFYMDLLLQRVGGLAEARESLDSFMGAAQVEGEAGRSGKMNREGILVENLSLSEYFRDGTAIFGDEQVA